MALEDFFTLSEMKDGLGTVARVEELISVMEKQRDCSVNNLDAARQWCTVARILMATEENCLIHFLKLNGLCYLNGWLQDAQKINNDTNDCSAEELLDLLLGALEKLPVTQDNLNSSGIAVTLEQIQGRENSNAQNRVRELIAKWEKLKNVIVACHENMIENDKKMETGNARQTDSMIDGDVPSSKGRVDEVDCGAKSVEVGPFDMDLRNSTDPCTADVLKDTKVALENQQKLNNSTSSERNTIQEDGGTVSSSAVLPDKKVIQQSSIYSSVKAPDSGIICSTISIERDVDDQPEHPKKEPPSSVPEDMEVEEHCEDLSKTNDNVNYADLSSAGVKHVERSLMKDQEMHLDTEEDVSDTERTGKNVESKGLRSSGVKSESSEVTIRQKEYRGTAEGTKEIDISFSQTGKRSNSKVHRGFSRSIGAHASMHKNTEEVTLGYGDDALDFAVQVAIEAQREVADREQLSSSSEGKSVGEILDSGSSKLDDNSEQSDLSKSTSKLHDSDGESSMSKKSSRTTEKIDDSKDTGQKMDSPKSSSGVMEPKGHKDKSGCGFDLNDDAFAEEPTPTYGVAGNLSAPRAVVAISKGPSSIPITPLHFEGELGWRGSAATSAFRPASPRRTPDSEKNVSTSKRTSNFLDFDLNVAEMEDDVVVDQVLEKLIPDSSDLPSRDSSIEVSSRRTEKLKLDLNSLGDEDPYAFQSAHWTHHHQNGNASASSASFSSARQQTMRDIDLNDNPSFVDQCGPQNLNRPSKDPSTFETHKVDDSVINIMGSRMSVELDRKEPVNQTQSFLPNGIIMGSTSGRPPMFYTPMPGPAYGYNNLTVPPNMPLPPAIYGAGSIPYMVDSRGTTVIPQVLGPPAGLNGVPPSRPPFFVSLAGVPQGFPPVGAPRPNLDLNAGMICLDGGGNREVGGYRPMCMPGYSGLSEEQMRASSQPGSGSVIGLKRKEPTDLVWDPYPVDHKKVTSWK